MHCNKFCADRQTDRKETTAAVTTSTTNCRQSVRACLMKKHSSRPASSSSQAKQGLAAVCNCCDSKAESQSQSNVYWWLRTHNKSWGSRQTQCAKSSKPAPNVANCETQTWPRQRATWWCVLQQQPDGNFLRLFDSMTVCGQTASSLPFSLFISVPRSLQLFHSVCRLKASVKFCHI